MSKALGVHQQNSVRKIEPHYLVKQQNQSTYMHHVAVHIYYFAGFVKFLRYMTAGYPKVPLDIVWHSPV